MNLLFTTSGELISRLIRFFTKSKTSHVMISLDLYGVPMLLHCTSGGVQFTPREKWLRSNTVVEEFKIKKDLTPNLNRTVQLLGEKYDYLSVVGFLPVLFFRWFKKKIKNPLASPRAMVCSEFVLHLDANNEIPEWVDLDRETTTAQDVLDLCEHGESFERV